MKTPLLVLVAALALIVLLALPVLFSDSVTQQMRPEEMPWRIERDEKGETRVLGISLGRSTLKDVKARFGGELEVAIVVARGIEPGKEAENAALEGYYERIMLGQISARLVVTLAASAKTLAALLNQAGKAEALGSGSRKYALPAGALTDADRWIVAAITLIPSASLDETQVERLFGAPARVYAAEATLKHYLYPERGLDIVLDEKGKDIFQYVAPSAFETRILRPLNLPSSFVE
ncbi:MAG: hypothetical protein LBG69_00715 [Zoogloeaceae bacterium]|jgi:hypothetical protein|nr:hypothetical protein [Zoogloeaceae bacterium]